jgi:hypothetical protein
MTKRALRNTIRQGNSLYELLSEPAPAGVTAGETRITATKETLDDDREDSFDDDTNQFQHWVSGR